MGMHVKRTGIRVHVLKDRKLVYVVDGTKILFCEDIGETLDGYHMLLDRKQNLVLSDSVFDTHAEAIKCVMHNWRREHPFPWDR